MGYYNEKKWLGNGNNKYYIECISRNMPLVEDDYHGYNIKADTKEQAMAIVKKKAPYIFAIENIVKFSQYCPDKNKHFDVPLRMRPEIN